MAFCVQCGNQVGEADVFCAKCGQKQGAPPRPQNPSDVWNNISEKNASLLCYIPWVGWIAAVAVLASARFRGKDRVRFHAFQGLYLFVAWMLMEMVLVPFFFRGNWGFQTARFLPGMLQLIIFVGWIIMLIKVNQNEDYRLPIIGEMAERSVAEQRS